MAQVQVNLRVSAEELGMLDAVRGDEQRNRALRRLIRDAYAALPEPVAREEAQEPTVAAPRARRRVIGVVGPGMALPPVGGYARSGAAAA